MKEQKSYKVELTIEDSKIEELYCLEDIKINEIIKHERTQQDDEDFFLRLPDDKHGVYVVYDNNGDCIYVGETKQQNGFRGRFSNHDYLTEFRTRAAKILLYVIDKQYDNDRLLFEKLKIKELNPTLNKAENKDLSLSYTKEVLEELRKKVIDLLDFLPNKEKIKINEEELKNIDKRVAKNFHAVLYFLNEIVPNSLYCNGGEIISLTEIGVETVTSDISFLNLVDCTRCNDGGDECKICQNSRKLIVTSKCNKCDEGIVSSGYCSKCDGTGYDKFKPYTEENSRNFTVRVCPSCEGNGKNVNDKTCDECKGQRYVVRK